MGALLLDIMLPFFHKNVERLFTRDLLVWLNGFEDRPWMEMKRGKEITERWLSQRLRPYGVRPRMMRIGEAQARGYLKDELADVLRRYLQQSDYDALKSEMFVTDETPEDRSPSKGAKPDQGDIKVNKGDFFTPSLMSHSKLEIQTSHFTLRPAFPTLTPSGGPLNFCAQRSNRFAPNFRSGIFI